MTPDTTRTNFEEGTRLPYLTASTKCVTETKAPRPRHKVTATSKAFQYSALQDNQIRVLRISIDLDTNFLICDFDIRDLSDCQGTYKAISYCWGDPKPTCSVLCGTGDYLNLTESAAEILRYVSARNPEDWFWIDQLCINQSNLAERSAQVSIMGPIYSSTKQVIAWLGRGTKDTQKAMAFIEEMSLFIHDLKCKGVQPTLKSFFKTSARFHNIPRQLNELRKWKALRELLANSWFERVWVVQEVVMAADKFSHTGSLRDPIVLVFENCTISFEIFATVIQTISDDHLYGELAYDHKDRNTADQLGQYPPGFNAVRIYLMFRKIRKEKTEPLSMSWALIYTKNFEATDYRDKIYAVMNFTDPANLGLKPDYECPLDEVFTSCATKLIEENEYPIILHIAGVALQKPLSTLPSWVPDFSPSPFSVNIKSRITMKWFEASGNPPINTIKPHLYSKIMTFMGIKIDTVEILFRQPSPDEIGQRGLSKDSSSLWNPVFKTAQKVLFPQREYYQSYLNFFDDVGAFMNNSPANSKLQDPQTKKTLFYTLIRDYPVGEATVDSDLLDAYDAWHDSLRELAGHGTIKSFFASATRKPEIYSQIEQIEDLVGSAQGPLFGMTTRRLLGSGLGGMQPGDIVCVIMGARTPFLLRPDTEYMGHDGGQRWKLVGPCFVYGLMYGEGLSMGEQMGFVVT